MIPLTIFQPMRKIAETCVELLLTDMSEKHLRKLT